MGIQAEGLPKQAKKLGLQGLIFLTDIFLTEFGGVSRPCDFCPKKGAQVSRPCDVCPKQGTLVVTPGCDGVSGKQ